MPLALTSYMRVLVMAGLVGAALATPAAACPRGLRCIALRTAPADFTAVRSIPQETAAPAVATTVSLTLHLAGQGAPVDRHALLHRSLSSFEPIVARADELELPWIWAVLATEVKRHLPRYDQANQFSMVLSPVVVSMPTESTPGLGLSGDF